MYWSWLRCAQMVYHFSAPTDFRTTFWMAPMTYQTAGLGWATPSTTWGLFWIWGGFIHVGSVAAKAMETIGHLAIWSLMVDGGQMSESCFWRFLWLMGFGHWLVSLPKPIETFRNHRSHLEGESSNCLDWLNYSWAKTWIGLPFAKRFHNNGKWQSLMTVMGNTTMNINL